MGEKALLASIHPLRSSILMGGILPVVAVMRRALWCNFPQSVQTRPRILIIINSIVEY